MHPCRSHTLNADAVLLFPGLQKICARCCVGLVNEDRCKRMKTEARAQADRSRIAQAKTRLSRRRASSPRRRSPLLVRSFYSKESWAALDDAYTTNPFQMKSHGMSTANSSIIGDWEAWPQCLFSSWRPLASSFVVVLGLRNGPQMRITVRAY